MGRLSTTECTYLPTFEMNVIEHLLHFVFTSLPYLPTAWLSKKSVDPLQSG